MNNDWLSPPGDTIFEALEEKVIGVEEFCNLSGFAWRDFWDVLDGEKPITPELAIKISSVLGYMPEFWLELEHNYQKDKLRLLQNPLGQEDPY
jgi:HTH-type transcriptional regulator/antitoxin HigA